MSLNSACAKHPYAAEVPASSELKNCAVCRCPSRWGQRAGQSQREIRPRCKTEIARVLSDARHAGTRSSLDDFPFPRYSTKSFRPIAWAMLRRCWRTACGSSRSRFCTTITL